MSPAITRLQSTRPSPNTVADIPAIIEATRGTPDGLEKIRETSKGLQYLKDNEDEYLSVSPVGITRGNARSDSNSSISSSNTESSSGESSDEVFIYHGFWSGPFNWRVELFIKSYFFTQNVALSRLWLWIDVAKNPSAIEEVLAHPLAVQFAPLLESGHLVFQPWTLPDRIPLPSGLDNSDGMGFLNNAERRSAYGFPDCDIIDDAVMRDPRTGEEFLVTNAWAKSVNPSLVSISDIVRFVVLHLHGGMYLDIDMLLLKDMRPLLISHVDFAERWGAYAGQGDFNTAVLALRKMTSLSAYFLRTGVRLGLLFHPRIMGWHALKDGRVKELAMLESSAFDQVWLEFAGTRDGTIVTPSFSNFTQVFEADFVDEKLGKKRNLDDFFAGSWAYHMHNQVSSIVCRLK